MHTFIKWTAIEIMKNVFCLKLHFFFQVGEITETITANKILLPKYTNTGRIQFEVTPMGDSTMYKLTISGMYDFYSCA